MPSMDVVFTQILVIPLYILVGFAAGRLRLIDADQRKYLTTLCTNLILPSPYSPPATRPSPASRWRTWGCRW